MDNLRDNYTVVASKSQADFGKRLAADWDIRLDAEFEALLCPQVDIEQTAFEASILREGCRDVLIVWRGPRILVDGYHRYKFCAAHDIPFAVAEMNFTHRGEAREWIIMNQLARRNLPMHERARLALELKPIYEEKAKANLHLSEGRGKKGCQISDNVIDTKKELAKIAGVSHDTISKVEKIESEAPEPIKQASRRGEISVNTAYQITKLPEEKRQEISDEAERGEKPIKQIVNDAIKAEREVGYMQEAAVAFSSGEAYNLDNLVEEVIENGEDCVDAIRTQIETRITLFDSAGGRIADAIDKIINSFVELKREVNEKWK